jgi:tRNA dimethylallyltransferase
LLAELFSNTHALTAGMSSSPAKVNQMSADVVLIAGPTASGKSALALALAERLRAVIINADSMQVYSEIPILSARPTAAERARALHALYGHVSVHERYSAGRYQAEAAAALAAARTRGQLAIFVGGTGLYFDALTSGLSPIPAVPAQVRADLRARFHAMGRDAFWAQLERRDPATLAKLRPSDTQRILRAAEVLEATGRPLADWQAIPPQPVLSGLNAARFVISPARDVLAQNIDRRFQSMLEQGALEEARTLIGLDPTLPAAKALGLPELWRFLAGEVSLETAAQEAQTATKRYVKRQLTWFCKRMAVWKWLQNYEISNIISTIETYTS